MIIEKMRIGAHSRRTVYALCSDATENGDKRPHEIARFEKLELAALVMRYMLGDSMNEADTYRATAALKKADAAPTKAHATA